MRTQLRLQRKRGLGGNKFLYRFDGRTGRQIGTERWGIRRTNGLGFHIFNFMIDITSPHFLYNRNIIVKLYVLLLE
jgi:hypothetical protein